MNPHRAKHVLGILAALCALALAVPATIAAEKQDGQTLLFEMSEPEELAAALAAASGEAQTAAAGVAPLIDLWHGAGQSFGRLGHPQRYVNIVGKVTDGSGVQSLKYALNGGSQQALSIGPDGRRLSAKGDFNIDIHRSRLQAGTNQIVITARDSQGNTSTETVTLNYDSDTSWPGRYAIDWSQVSDLQDVAEVVDGQWEITPDGLRTVARGYDRLVAIGDMAWMDYEITVPVTVHSRGSSGSPGVGILMRWKGHTDDPVSGWQPKSGWYPLGALGWYRWFDSGAKNLRIDGNRKRFLGSRNKALKLNTAYIFKMRVETRAGRGGYYRLKMWQAGAQEPSGWDVSGQEALNDPQNGSVLLLAHKVDATFGNVQIRPLGGIHSLTVETEGQGAVAREPEAAAYADGEVVRLVPEPAPGWVFERWSGTDASALADNGDGTWSLEMAMDRSVTAVFAPGCYSLAIEVQPDGAGAVQPKLPPNCGQGGYAGGTVVALAAQPAPGYTLGHWSGTLSGRANPGSLVIRGDTVVTANFVQQANVFEEDFEGYGAGAEPDGWYDSAAGNSMAQDEGLFQVYGVGGSSALGTLSTQSNIHSHYVGGGSRAWSGYRYWGRMMMTAATGGIGVTFYSQYANQDVYYRLRRYGGNAFHLAPHPHNAVQLEGDTDTGVTPRPGDWYWFRVEVEDAGQRTEIRAKVWPQGSPEPEDWQVNAWHGGSRRPLAGRIGLWSYAAGAKYWDDLLVYPVQPRQVWTLELTELGQGTITAEPDQAQYQDGQEVSLTAVGSPGWRFEAWGGDLAGSDSPARLAMDGDKQVQATFVQEAYTLDVQVIGSGAVTATPNQGTYGHGEIVSLRAVAAKGWRLDRWEGDLTGAANPVRLAMDGNKTVVALFVPEAYALTIDVEGSGQATATPQKATYTYQEAVQIEAVPEAGWAFSGWSGDLSGTENPATVIIQRDTLVTARFQPGLALYAEDFEGYSAGADPEGWLDTQAGNSMAQNDPLFSVFDTGGNRAFGTRSTDTNIHSHYVGSGSRTWSGYRYRGRMMMTAATGGLGVTLYSQYADRDAYYRLRRYGTRTFHLAPHPHRTVTLQGDTDTGQRPQRDIWYWFVLEVEDTGGRTEIRAKVWPEGTGEPEAWQVNAWHSGSGRLLSGRIGVWSYSLGAKYWDDLVVEPIE